MNDDGMETSENGDETEGSENHRMDSDGENNGSDEHVSTNRNKLPVKCLSHSRRDWKRTSRLSLTIFSTVNNLFSHTKTI